MGYRDFIGQEIIVGSYFAHPGASGKKEDGMILYKVTELLDDESGIIAFRTEVILGNQQKSGVDRSYHEFHPSILKRKHMMLEGNCILSIDAKITNFNKVVIVNPSIEVRTIFDKCIALDRTVIALMSTNDIREWIAGNTNSLNPFNTDSITEKEEEFTYMSKA